MFGIEKCDFIYNRFRYLINIKSGITYAIPNNYAKIKVDSHDSLPLEKTMTFADVTILIQSVFNKDKNNYYHILRNSFVWITKKIKFSIKYKCYPMIKLMFLKELMLIREANQKSVIFVTIGIL